MPGVDPQIMASMAAGQGGLDPRAGIEPKPQELAQAPGGPPRKPKSAPRLPKPGAQFKGAQDFMASTKAKKGASPPKPRPSAADRMARRYGGKQKVKL
jgi:hypothetical protein